MHISTNSLKTNGKSLLLAVFAALLLCLTSAASAQAQLTGTKNVPGDYADLNAAITDLNAQGVGAGGVTINVVAGNPQTAPAGGYVIGGTNSLVLTTASAANPITIQGNGNTATAFAPQTAGSLNDAIFKLIGADFVTLTGFNMQENAANTTFTAASNNATEFGVALFYATTTNGAQNNTIDGNTIDLTRLYQNSFGIFSTNATSATALTTTANSTTAAGANSNTIIRGNTITDVNNAIAVIGSGNGSADQNTNITVGGALAAQGNTITNFGSTGTFSAFPLVSGTVNAVQIRNSTALTVSNNSITSASGATGVTSGTLRAIFVPAASVQPVGTFTNNFNNNTVALTTNVAGGAVAGIAIETTTGTATSTTNINSNNFTALNNLNAAPTGAITAISQAGSVTAGPLVSSVSNNTFTALTSASTGSFTFISNTFTAPTNATKNVNNNQIVNGFTKTSAGGTVTFFVDNGSDTAGTINNSNNNTVSNVTLSSTTGTGIFVGIANTNGGAPTKNVTGNTISNINMGAQTGAFTGISTDFDGGTTVVSGNTVNTITTNGTTNGILGGTSATGTRTIAQNTILGLTGSGTGVVTGISNTGGTTVNIARNKVSDISNTNAGGTASGLTNSSGTTVSIQNNLVGNITAPNLNATNSLFGINVSGGTTVNVSFNTVYLAATSSGTNFGSSALSASTTPTVTLRNNILANLSTPAGTGSTVAYRRSSTTLTTYGSASNNNDFFAGAPSANRLIFFDGTNSDQTLTAYKARVSPRDSASISENPPFISTTGSSPQFLHISAATATQLESGGTPINGITDDFDGETRNNPPDIGADEFAGTALDLTAPTIVYTNPGNTTSTQNRTITATISDATGVAGGAFAPRIYFKKSTDANYVSTQCAMTGGTMQSGTYACTINYALVGNGSVAAGDTIQYFIVAQDTNSTPNVGANPGGGFAATDVNNVTAPPTTPNSFTIVAPFASSATVGANGTYASLTNAGGLFEAMNAGVFTGNTTISIVSDLTGETGAVALNQLTEEGAGAGTFTVTIKPQGAVRAITSTTTAGTIIRLNGTDRVTIDGSLTANGTDRSLSIVNANTTGAGGAIFVGSQGAGAGANNVTIKNTNLQAGNVGGVGTGTFTYGIFVGNASGAAAGPDNDNLTIQNNLITRARTGIQAVADATGLNDNLQIVGNTIGDTAAGTTSIGRIGMTVSFANNATITGNTVQNVFLTGDTSSPIGISISSLSGTNAGGTVIGQNTIANVRNDSTAIAYGIIAGTLGNTNVTQNTITNITNTSGNSALGMQLFGVITGSTVTRNNISNVAYTGTGGYGGKGIDVNGTTNGTIANNFVSNIRGDAFSAGSFINDTVIGIRVIGATGGTSIVNNSVCLCSGAFAGNSAATVTMALYINSTGAAANDIRNNILVNNLDNTTVTTDKNYAFYAASLPATYTTNYNDYFVSGTAGVLAAVNVGGTIGDQATLPALQTATGQDQNSISADPQFVSATDLHLQTTSPVLNAGVALANVVNDFDNDLRDTPPDIGADEITTNGRTGTVPAGTYRNANLGASTLGGSVTITGALTLSGVAATGANSLTIACGASVTGASQTSYVDGTVVKNYCAPEAFVYPIGDNGYSPLTANVTTVNGASSLAVDANDSTLPGLNNLTSVSRHWVLTETGDITADLSFAYLEIDTPDTSTDADETDYRVFRRAQSGRPISQCPNQPCVDALNNVAGTVFGVTNFSPWGIGTSASNPPTAAAVNIGGRVTTHDGRGIRNVAVTMTDQNGAQRTTLTGAFGYYQFANVSAGQSVIVAASAKRFVFGAPSQIVNVAGDATEINFTAVELRDRQAP